MSDWRPRLIASDMDGTLLRCDDTVSEATVARAGPLAGRRRPGRAGHRPPAALDARHPRGARHGTRGLLQRRGAAGPRAASRSSTRTRCSPTCCEAVTAELRRRQPDTWFAVEYGLEFRHEPIYRPRWDVDAPGVAEATLEEMVAAPVAKLLARHESLPRDEFVALVEDVVGDRATVTNSSADALAEISAPGVTKATGLAKVAARHGIGPADVVVFGDMPNDIAAFEWVRDGRRPRGGDGARAPRPAGRRHRRHRHQRGRRRRRVPRRALTGAARPAIIVGVLAVGVSGRGRARSR